MFSSTNDIEKYFHPQMIKKNVNFQAHDIYVSRIFEPGAVGKEGI